MNTTLTVKHMHTFDMQISDIVPLDGEIIMDATTNKVKIGDGKTPIKDLPWYKFDVDSTNEESSLSRTARMFIENNIDLIEDNDYDTLYSHIATPALAQEVTRALLKADLNPKPYLSKIPQSIKHILEPEDVWVDDTTSLYTREEINAMINKWTNNLFTQMGIPKSMIKAGN